MASVKASDIEPIDLLYRRKARKQRALLDPRIRRVIDMERSKEVFHGRASLGSFSDRAGQGARRDEAAAADRLRQEAGAAAYRSLPLGLRRQAAAGSGSDQGLARQLRHGRLERDPAHSDTAPHRAR